MLNKFKAKNMKLELKHIAPYLAHGLKINCGHLYGLRELTHDYFDDSKVCLTAVLRANFKPLLLPLSALTEPMEGHDKTTWLDYLWFEVIGTDSDCFDKSEFEILCQYDTNLAPYKVVEYLFSNHFDIYGLIESGLAIDKRALNYKL